MKQARFGHGRGYVPATPSDIINRPGVFMMIPVADLHVDTTYQRGLIGNRVDAIANNWSWVAFGVIAVALRGVGSGDYYVIDGQHRVAAAERTGVVEVPCIVYETANHEDEAQGFLDTNTNRKAMSVIDRYRALLVVGDPIALKVQALLDAANRVPKQGASDGNSIKCLDYMMQAISTDADLLERIWPLVIDICDNRLIVKRLMQGLFYTERFLTNTSLLDRHWRRRLLQVGYDGLTKSIDETCAYEGRSGAAVCAAGVLRAVNKGLRNKLTLSITNVKEETDE